MTVSCELPALGTIQLSHNKEKTSHVCKWALASWTGFLNKRFSGGRRKAAPLNLRGQHCGPRVKWVIQSDLIRFYNVSHCWHFKAHWCKSSVSIHRSWVLSEIPKISFIVTAILVSCGGFLHHNIDLLRFQVFSFSLACLALMGIHILTSNSDRFLTLYDLRPHKNNCQEKF